MLGMVDWSFQNEGWVFGVGWGWQLGDGCCEGLLRGLVFIIMMSYLDYLFLAFWFILAFSVLSPYFSTLPISPPAMLSPFTSPSLHLLCSSPELNLVLAILPT
jgi:hypothetical protein